MEKTPETEAKYYVVAERYLKIPGKYFWSFPVTQKKTRWVDITEEQYELLDDFVPFHHKGWTIKTLAEHPEITKLITKLLED